MNFRKLIKLGLIVLLSLPFLYLRSYAQPKAEMRGVWVATLLNIDWPSSPDLSTVQQKQEVNAILDHHRSLGFNAIFLQVRPASDAFYKSSFEPWSKWLTGVQGKEPRPFYDPLEYWIEECHKRGMELHAWLNPFRAAVHRDMSRFSPNNVIKENPHWTVGYGDRLYFNPGLPEARAYVERVIMEVVSNYDIDGIHFDDYFYPYKIEGQEFADQQTFLEFGSEYVTIADWRRANISKFIQNISIAINKTKPGIRFGVSPFGVWRNVADDVKGSNTQAGQTSFDDLYADVLLWLREGWIDYLAPQIYWHIGFELADYQVLLDWWSRHSYDRHIYIGQSAYKIRRDADFKEWQDPGELPRHIKLNQQYPQIKGNIYFSSSSIRTNALGFGDSLRYNYQKYQALIPPMEYKPVINPKTPYLYRISHGHKKLTIYWSGEDQSRYQIVYRNDGESPDGTRPENIIAFLPPGTTSFEDVPPKKGYYTYVVTSVSKTNHESPAGPSLTINYRKRKPRKKKIKT